MTRFVIGFLKFVEMWYSLLKHLIICNTVFWGMLRLK